jgi:hypothetical protein
VTSRPPNVFQRYEQLQNGTPISECRNLLEHTPGFRNSGSIGIAAYLEPRYGIIEFSFRTDDGKYVCVWLTYKDLQLVDKKLEVGKRGFPYWERPLGLSEAVLSAEDEWELYEASKPAKGSLAGVVRMQGKPVGGIEVTLTRADWREEGGYEATTDRNGAFELSDLPVRDYFVLMKGPGVPSKYADRKQTPLTLAIKKGDNVGTFSLEE